MNPVEAPPDLPVILNSSSGSQRRLSAGFASLINLKDGNCPVTRARRIQINQLGLGISASSKSALMEIEGREPVLKKRWSFHSATQVNELSGLIKNDRSVKPVLSPKRRKSSSFRSSNPNLGGFGENSHPILKFSEDRSSSQSSKHALSNHRQKFGPIIKECEASTSTSKSRQRMMEEYLTHSDPYPSNYHHVRVRSRHKYLREPPPPDHMSTMPDEILLRIFKLLPKSSLSNLGRTNGRFHGLIEDDTLWKRLCLMGRILSTEHLHIIMSRKPVYLRMARATIPDSEDFPEDLTSLALSSQLLYLDLSSSTLSTSTLDLIMKISPKLIKLSLEHLRVPKNVLESMMCFAPTIEVLNLAMTYEIDSEAIIEFFAKCTKLKELNMGCIKCDWTKEDLTGIVNALPGTLLQLNISGFRNTLNDDHVSIIANRCPKLIELDVSDSQEVQSKSIEHIMKLKHLQHLGLSRCYGIEPPAYTMLSGNKYLKYLDLFSLFKETSIKQLCTTLPGIEINKFPFSAIARPTVGNKRSSIWLQRVRD